MYKVDFVPTFKKAMSNIEIEGVIAIVRNYEYNTGDFNAHSIESGDFVYTSSSSYAMLSIDGLAYYDEDAEDLLDVSHFAITENNRLIAVCEDDDENRYYYEIETSEF